MNRSLLLIVVLGASAAGAEPPSTARDLYKQARQRYEAGAFEEAATLFQRSYDLSRAPGLLFNLGQARRNQGDCALALAAYRAYLAQVPRAPNVPEVKELIAAMERCEAERRAVPETTPVEPLPPAPPLPPETGLIALPPPPPPPSPWLTVAAVSLDVLGAAALGVGAGFAVSASNASTRLSDLYLGRLVWSPELATLERNGRRDSLIGVTLLSVGAALAVTGLIITIIRLASEPSSAAGALAWSGASF